MQSDFVPSRAGPEPRMHWLEGGIGCVFTFSFFDGPTEFMLASGSRSIRRTPGERSGAHSHHSFTRGDKKAPKTLVFGWGRGTCPLDTANRPGFSASVQTRPVIRTMELIRHLKSSEVSCATCLIKLIPRLFIIYLGTDLKCRELRYDIQYSG